MPALIASVTAPQRLVKDTAESRVYAMEFSRLLIPAAQNQAAETITSIVSIAATPTGTADDVTVSAQTIAGTQVQCRLAGGASGTTYRLTVTIATSLGNTLVGEGFLIIGD